MVEFPPVYRPKPYSKPTAHLKSHLQVLLDDGAEIATFVYTPGTPADEKPYKDLTSTAAYLTSISDDTFAAPIVFLHGNGEEHGIFGTIIDEVCNRGYTAIGIDSRDQGQSTRGTASFTYEQMTKDTYTVLKQLGISSAHIVGFSDGAILSLLLARDYPDIVSSLVSIGANLEPDTLGDMTWLYESIEGNKRWAAEGWEGAVLEDGYPVPSPAEAARIAEHLELMVDNPHIDPATLKHISVPVVVMAGEYDEIYPEETRRIAEAIPTARLLFIPGCPHNVPKVSPGAVVRRIFANLSYF